MATAEADSQYEASDESSENELLDCSLSVWKGLGWNVKERFDPVPLDLHTASSIGQYDCVRDFISKKVDLDKKNRGGWTPLMYACYIGHDNIVNLLLDASVNVNVKNLKGQTPLMLAASCGNESVGYFLCQQGAELEARDAKGWTALFHATYAGHQNMVKFLLEQGANINAVEPSFGFTPFMEAAAEGHEIIVQLFLQHGVNVNRKAYNGDTARSLALIHSNMKIVSLIDNHVMPNTCLRSEAGLEADLSSSDEGYPKKRGHKGQKGKGRVPSIRDGPDAIARLIDRSRNPDSTGHPKVPKGYVTFPQDEGEDEATKLSYRDVTSPINMQDYKALDSSGGKDSVDNDIDEDGNAFSKTCALTIKSSSGSSVGLMAALGLSHSSMDSEDSHPQDSPSSLDDSAGAGDLGGSSGFHDDDLSPASSYHKAMEKVSIKEGTEVKITGDEKTHGVGSSPNDKQSKEKHGEVHVHSSEPEGRLPEVKIPSVSPKPSAMSPTSQLKDREKQSNKSRSNSPSVKFNTQDIIVPPPPVHHQQHHQPVQPTVPPIPPTVPVLPQQKVPFEQPSHYAPHLPHPYSNTAKPTHDQQNLNYDFGKPPLTDPPPGFTNIATNFSTQLGCQLFPQGVGDRGFFGQPKDSDDYPRDLRALLEQLGLTKYMNVFEEQDVDLQVFLSLTDQDLKEIGIKLFGPRKKMTNAIARWQSKAPLPASNKIEQAYADRLEGEMQEMALQLHKSAEQVETLKAEVLQEKQIRIVTETCLNEERGAWHHMQRVILEMRQKCDEMRESLRNLKHYHSEIKLKFQNPDMGGAMKEDLPLDEKSWQSANERAASADLLLKKVEQQIKDIQKNLSVVAMHGDRILGRSTNTPEGSFT